MAFSRNAQEYLERKGLVNTVWPPRPRLDVSSLLVNSLPLGKPEPTQYVLERYEGWTPPDRGMTKPWPNQVDDYGQDA